VKLTGHPLRWTPDWSDFVVYDPFETCRPNKPERFVLLNTNANSLRRLEQWRRLELELDNEDCCYALILTKELFDYLEIARLQQLDQLLTQYRDHLGQLARRLEQAYDIGELPWEAVGFAEAPDRFGVSMVANLTESHALQLAMRFPKICQSVLFDEQSLGRYFALAALLEIDDLLMRLINGRGHAWGCLITATENYCAAASLLQKDGRTDGFAVRRAKLAARSRWMTDPRSVDKAFVRDCWHRWQNNPSTYESKAAFAKDMLDKCENLKSQKVIEDWCRDWEKAR